MDILTKLLAIALAGALGSLCRYGLTATVERMALLDFPLGTFVVNMLGSLAFGVVFAVCESRVSLSPQAQVILLTGFMGAFTTFSTFAFQTHGLLREGAWLAALANAGGQVLVGVACVALGLWLGTRLMALTG